ncbi:MAG: thioesterase family protein, partial [Pseudomonadota bacterium]
LGHVNNAVYATFYESGRVHFLYGEDGEAMPDGKSFVIAELTIKFIAEILYPGQVEVRSGISRIGNASAQLVQEIWADGELKSTAQSVVVMIDSTARRSTPIDDGTRARLEKLLVTA